MTQTTGISKSLAFEIADNWEKMAATEKVSSPQRRETLRECADLIRMLSERPTLPVSLATRPKADFIGGFPEVSPNCKGCGKPLLMENAWMTDGCPCNTPLGINNQNETRWRLLMQAASKQSFQIAAARKLADALEDAKSQYFMGSSTRTRCDEALQEWKKEIGQ